MREVLNGTICSLPAIFACLLNAFDATIFVGLCAVRRHSGNQREGSRTQIMIFCLLC